MPAQRPWRGQRKSRIRRELNLDPAWPPTQPLGHCTYGHSCEQTLRHVGDDDSDEEDDSIEPEIAEDEGDDEERDAEEHSNAGNEVDEMLDLLGNWRLSHFQAGGQVGDAAHDSAVTGVDNDASCGAWKQEGNF